VEAAEAEHSKGEDTARDEDRSRGGDKDEDRGEDIGNPSIYSSM
jgi:hypothetical protein